MGTGADEEQQVTDSQLSDRCQELEGEVAKLLEVNQEIYDRALEMEERALQLEARITELEEEAEQLTMQLQNSWALGYKKGQHDSEEAITALKAEVAAAKSEAPGAVKSEAPAPPSIKSMIDFELSPEEKAAVLEEAVAHKIEAPAAETRQKSSIKSMIDFELPPEEKSPFENDSQDEGKDTAENPPVFAENEIVAQQENTAVREADKSQMQTGDNPVLNASENVYNQNVYNQNVYNVAGDTAQAGGQENKTGMAGMSWQEVETIYQHSANSNLTGSSLMFESKSAEEAAAAKAPHTVSEASPVSKSEPPILKADAQPIKPLASRTGTHKAMAKPEPEPPMELTMHQFLGDTDSYLSLDRVTFDPADESLSGPGQVEAEAEARPDVILEEDEDAYVRPSQEETQTLQGAREQLEAMTKAAQAQPGADARAKTQAQPMQQQVEKDYSANQQSQPAAKQESAAASTWQGLTPAQSPDEFAEPPNNNWATQPVFDQNQSLTGAAGAHLPPQSSGRREAGATYDGLNALESDSTADVLDLEKLDIFEGLEDIDELSQIEVIEDVILPDAPAKPSAKPADSASKYKSSDRIPAVSSDDLHDLIKSRIKKAEEPHEHRVEGFISHGSEKDKSPSPAPTPDPVNVTGTITDAPAVNASTGTTTDAAAVPTAKELEALRQGARNKFVGGSKSAGTAPAGAGAHGETTHPPGAAPGPSGVAGGETRPPSAVPISARTVPPEIRKACMILGVRPEDMTLKEVHEKWKAQIAAPGAHPDQGGDTESAIYLNTAKDTLVKWINDQAPKLGKKFGKKE